MTRTFSSFGPFLSLLSIAACSLIACSSGEGDPAESPSGDGGSGGSASGGSLSGDTGGTTGSGGGQSTGGADSSGGSDGAGGGTMRDIPSTQIVEEMFLGWNLGNTLDADPDETAWGNPLTTREMIDAVHDGGFNTVRIPVTWMHHMGGAPDYAVSGEWMDRVEEVVGYVLDSGMYAILNCHHEEWVSVMPDGDHDAIENRLALLWTQIANRFRDYDEHLVFETQNEPRTRDDTQWTGGTPAARQIINRYNLAAVNAIRATGGNNALRHIMVPTHAANAGNEVIADLVIPNDDPRIIVSLHTYYPYEVSLGSGSDWGTDTDIQQMGQELDRIYGLLPANGRAVVIGEWGTQHRNNTEVRAAHAETYARMVVERGMCPVWWDNGALTEGADGFGLLDRDASPPIWAFPTIVEGLKNGATAGRAAQ